MALISGSFASDPALVENPNKVISPIVIPPAASTHQSQVQRTNSGGKAVGFYSADTLFDTGLENREYWRRDQLC
jgi:hypothetical protein